MRNNKLTIAHGIAVLAGVLTLGLAGTALAFHGGGVAHCDGCHSIHNSADNPIGAPANNLNVVSAAVEHPLLLKGSDPSSTCLNCHGNDSMSEGVLSSDARNFSPGGDFFWLTQSYSWTGSGGPETSLPDNMGHNVIAVDFGLVVDGTNATAPGGGYPSANLSCISCHDPHGRFDGGTQNFHLPVSVSGSYGGAPDPGSIAGNYRLLGDVFYGMGAPAPIAVTSGYDEEDIEHPVYGTGMSEWCGTCHGDYQDAFAKHPAGDDEFLGVLAANYNSYITTGDFNGAKATAFTALVQFERQQTDVVNDLLPEVTLTNGPEASSTVICLSCHRAHASAFNNITRWDTEEEYLIDSQPNAAQLVLMGAVPNSPYYGRTAGTDAFLGNEFQRGLCNKCHVKD